MIPQKRFNSYDNFHDRTPHSKPKISTLGVDIGPTTHDLLSEVNDIIPLDHQGPSLFCITVVVLCNILDVNE